MHLAFEVEDVKQAMAEVLRHGGRAVGAIASLPIYTLIWPQSLW
jgi:hypothetical protein